MIYYYHEPLWYQIFFWGNFLWDCLVAWIFIKWLFKDSDKWEK